MLGNKQNTSSYDQQTLENYQKTSNPKNPKIVVTIRARRPPEILSRSLDFLDFLFFGHLLRFVGHVCLFQLITLSFFGIYGRAH